MKIRSRIAAGGLALLFLVPLAACQRGARPNIVLIITDDQRYDALGASGNTAIHTPAMDRLAREGAYFRQATTHAPRCLPSRATLLTGLASHQLSSRAGDIARADASRLPMLPALLKAAGYRTVFIGKWQLAPDPWICGFSDVRSWLPSGTPYRNGKLAHGNSRAVSVQTGFTNQILGDDAVAFLESEDARQGPFFLWLALTAPHLPTRPNPPDIQALYAGRSSADLLPPGFPRDRDSADWNHYYQACTTADRQVGRVLDALDQHDLASDTLVVFLGDNGLMMGGRDVERRGRSEPYRGKVFPYEDSIRIPMILRGPGIAPGASDAPVSSLDLPTTMLAAAGLPTPERWPGRDLHRSAAISEAFSEFADNPSGKFGDVAYRLVRTPTRKLIVYENPSHPVELYDLQSDPRESRNLVGDPAAREVQRDLRSRLRSWARQTADPALHWPQLADDDG